MGGKAEQPRTMSNLIWCRGPETLSIEGEANKERKEIWAWPARAPNWSFLNKILIEKERNEI